jgi:hypothetical protein
MRATARITVDTKQREFRTKEVETDEPGTEAASGAWRSRIVPLLIGFWA